MKEQLAYDATQLHKDDIGEGITGVLVKILSSVIIFCVHVMLWGIIERTIKQIESMSIQELTQPQK